MFETLSINFSLLTSPPRGGPQMHILGEAIDNIHADLGVQSPSLPCLLFFDVSNSIWRVPTKNRFYVDVYWTRQPMSEETIWTGMMRLWFHFHRLWRLWKLPHGGDVWKSPAHQGPPLQTRCISGTLTTIRDAGGCLRSVWSLCDARHSSRLSVISVRV